MKQILFVLMFLLSLGASAQRAQEPQKFNYVMYAEKSVKGDTILGAPKVYQHESLIIFYHGSIDVFTFNWNETLVRESKITKDSYVCRTRGGELAIISFIKTKKPKQVILAIMYNNRNYWFLKKLK